MIIHNLMGCCNSLNTEPSQLLIAEHYDSQQRPPLAQSNNTSASSQINQALELRRVRKLPSIVSESAISSIYEADNDLPLPDLTNDNPCGFLLPEGQASYLT
ncbi:unnamed protein product [Blepharisma stoltei]|uniref:Uncharacterized protein n=1 Tax=Blepharisma stoltei TaxID=1481888 RepID=A0AAU9K6Q2_9CILI|nr:unnamed protein product [Blepharisma stoltei]